ncbi:EAL domain-containing protein [Noviherbaspirillum agri]
MLSQLPGRLLKPPAPTSRKALSIKTKLVLVTVGLFILFIWLLALFSSTILKRQFEQVLIDEQFAATQRIAADIETKLTERIELLTGAAARVPANLNEDELDAYLIRLNGLHVTFTAGIAIIGMDGRTIADYPVAPGRRGTYFGDRSYFLKVVETARPYIDKPVMGRALKRPVLTIGVPVFDRAGKLRAVMTGITDLAAPNFLGVISSPAMAGKGEIFIASPHDNLFVAATDATQMLTALPPRGVNAIVDRFVDGFEGSGIGRNPQDVEQLYSARRVPSARWIVMSTLPAEVAFQPMRVLRDKLFLAAALMTVVAIFLMQWVARGLLRPLDRAGRAMRRMRDGRAPLSPLPVERDDEIGQLVANFNRLVEDRNRYETALEDSESRFRQLVESAPDAVFVQTHGRFVYLNNAALRLFGATSKEELIGQLLLDRAAPDFRADIADRIRRLIEERQVVQPEETRYLRLDNTTVDVEVSAVPFNFENENGALVFARNITERKRAEATQNKLNRALRLLSDCNMTLVHTQREQSLLEEICRLVVVNGGYIMAWVGYAEHDEDKTVRPMSQYGLDEGYLETANVSWGESERGRGTVGVAIRTGRIQVNRNFLTNPAMAPWREAARRRGYQSSISLPLVSEGRTFGALSIYSADPDSFEDDEVELLRELANDLAFGIATLRTRVQREEAEEKLAFLAHHDPLTHLPNRVLLRDRFDRAAARAGRAGHSVALLFLDLDNFKRVNDSLGHDVGDQLLVRMVERLQRCIRDSDTISRQGGDEFVIMLGDVSDSGTPSRIAQSILDAAADPFEIGNHTLSTSFSIGISLYPSDGTDFDTLLKHADAALYHAKDNGRDTYHFFAATMNVDALARMQLHSNLRKAVKNQEFLLHYQPQIDITTGGIVGAEALVRWQRPDEGLVAPGRFIPLAEENGLIAQIGEWVLNEACRQAKTWIDSGMSPLVVAVNLSTQQFRRGDIVETVARALDRSGLPPAHLDLELTESVLLQETGAVMDTLHKLKKLGVHLSIDDFGTGYSSLSYLKRLAVDKLKIDQSFVRDLADDADDAAIVKAVIQLGQALQLRVIAEGVETPEQLAFLRGYGCHEAQGYLITRPLPAAEFAAFATSLFTGRTHPG